MKIKIIHSRIINIFLVIILLVIAFHLIVYATVWRYDVHGKNMDDKTALLMYSEISIFDSKQYNWFNKNLERILESCKNEFCKVRVKARASGVYNYILHSQLTKYLTSIGRILFQNEAEALSFGIFWGYLSLHFLAYLLLACLIYTEKSKVGWWVLGGLLILLMTDELIFNLKLEYFSFLIPPKIGGDGYHPTIYVPRGPLALFYLALCVNYLFDNKKWIYFLFFLLPTIHLAHGTMLLSIFYLVLLLEMAVNLMQRKQIKKDLLFVLGGILFLLFVLLNKFYVSARPPLNFTLLIQAVIDGMNYKTFIIILFSLAFLYYCHRTIPVKLAKYPERVAFMGVIFLLTLEGLNLLALNYSFGMEVNEAHSIGKIFERINGSIYFITQALVLIGILKVSLVAVDKLGFFLITGNLIKRWDLVVACLFLVLIFTGEPRLLIENIRSSAKKMSLKYKSTLTATESLLGTALRIYPYDLKDFIHKKYLEDFSLADRGLWTKVSKKDGEIHIDVKRLSKFNFQSIDPRDEVRYNLNLYYLFRSLN